MNYRSKLLFSKYPVSRTLFVRKWSAPSITHNFVGHILNGYSFKKLFPNYVSCKIVGNNYNNFKYELGLITNTEDWDPRGDSGGLYFTCEDYIYDYFTGACNSLENDFYESNLFLSRNDDKIAFIELLDDQDIWIGYTECKTNSFIVKNIMSMHNYINQMQYDNPNKFLLFMKQYPHALQYVENQSTDICESAIRCDPMAIRHVKNQTEEMCRYSIQKNPNAIFHVRNKTIELCELAKNSAQKYPHAKSFKQIINPIIARLRASDFIKK